MNLKASIFSLVAAVLLFAGQAQAVKIADVTRIYGQQNNVLTGVGLVAVASAADPKEEAAKRALDMNNIALGLKLADLGRQAGSPEVLVGAAKLLNSVLRIAHFDSTGLPRLS